MSLSSALRLRPVSGHRHSGIRQNRLLAMSQSLLVHTTTRRISTKVTCRKGLCMLTGRTSAVQRYAPLHSGLRHHTTKPSSSSTSKSLGHQHDDKHEHEHDHDHEHGLFHTHVHDHSEGAEQLMEALSSGKIDRGTRITLLGVLIFFLALDTEMTPE